MSIFHSRAIIKIEFEVDIASPNGNALRGLVTVEGVFAQLVRLRPAGCHVGGCSYRPSICKISVPRMLPRMLTSSESTNLRINIASPPFLPRIGGSGRGKK